MRRILNKYSKVITSSEDESEVNEARKSPQGEGTSSEQESNLTSQYGVRVCVCRFAYQQFQKFKIFPNFK